LTPERRGVDMKVYKVVTASNGFKELEKIVSKMLNNGWECTGGIAFNHGHPYQAMTKEMPQKQDVTRTSERDRELNPILSAADAMKKLDELT
jgi:hypothetical protein